MMKCHETTSHAAYSPSVRTPKTGRRGAGMRSSGNYASAEWRSGGNPLDRSAHVLGGTACGRRGMHRSRCDPRVLDCQSSWHRLEGGTTPVTVRRGHGRTDG
jgi:hypothetical protein